MRLAIVFLLFFVLPVLGMVLVGRRQRQQRARDDIRGELDPVTATWLERREARRSGVRMSASAGRIVATSNLQLRPVGTHRVRAVFDYMSAARRDPGVVVAADARTGTAETVALAAMPAPMVRLWEPGLQAVDAEQCPTGWSLAVEPTATQVAVPDQRVVDALRRITPQGSAPGVSGPSAPDDLVAFVRFHRGRLRISFCGDSLYVMVGTRRDRDVAVRLADFLADHLAAGRPPAP